MYLLYTFIVTCFSYYVNQIIQYSLQNLTYTGMPELLRIVTNHSKMLDKICSMLYNSISYKNFSTLQNLTSRWIGLKPSHSKAFGDLAACKWLGVGKPNNYKLAEYSASLFFFQVKWSKLNKLKNISIPHDVLSQFKITACYCVIKLFPVIIVDNSFIC